MSDNSSIEWTDATWSPITGCTRVSDGCDNCYSARMTYRLEKMGQQKYAGLTVLNPKGDRHFNGVVKCHDDELVKPLKWKRPRKVFLNSMSDTFHRDVPTSFIHKILFTIQKCPHLTFQILTKRADRMAHEMDRWVNGCGHPVMPNVWFGTSVASHTLRTPTPSGTYL